MILQKPTDVEIVYFSLECSDKKRQYFYQLLNNEEKERADRYRFDIHRNRFITGRGTVREILAHIGKTKPQRIKFEVNSYGKPAIYEPEGLTGLKFNASSSHTMGVIAVANNIELGVDIEFIKLDSDTEDYDSIVSSEFTEEEYEWYNAQVRQDKVQMFYSIWTCKEAYLKALGIGLNEKLNSFSINFKHHQPKISYTQLESDDQSDFSLHQIMNPAGYITCLAIPGVHFNIKLSGW